MKKYVILIINIALLFCFTAESFAGSKNFFKQLFKAYKDYQEVNMALWLVGDVNAEKRFGKELRVLMSIMYREERDKKKKAYVRKIFERLKPYYRNHGMDFQIRLIRGKSANAFVIPGGYVYVFTGLLDMVSSDDELAAVIAHELAHAERRHSLKNFRVSVAAVALLNKVIKNENDRETWGAILNLLVMMKFSRTQEREADDIGQFRMAKAGFNPVAQVTVWEKFLKRGGNTKGIMRYIGSHPPSSERVQNAKDNLKKINFAQTEAFINTQVILKDTKENFLNNPSFEANLTKDGFISGWQITEGISGINNISVTGRQSLQLLSDQRLKAVRVLSDFIPITEKSDFIFSGYARSETGKQNLAIGLELYDSSKRLRDRIWAIHESAPLVTNWKKIVVRLLNSPKQKIFAKQNAFIRIILQNGPLSEGSIWIDSLRLKHTKTVDPINLLAEGDFELAGLGNKPLGVVPNKAEIFIDTGKFNTGYASLRMANVKDKDSGFIFKPISIGLAKKNREFSCSFFYTSEKAIEGLAVIETLDANGKILQKVTHRKFKTTPGKWKSNSIVFRLFQTNSEAEIAKKWRVRIIATPPKGSAIWFDSFVLR